MITVILTLDNVNKYNEMPAPGKKKMPPHTHAVHGTEASGKPVQGVE